ncbi:MAG: DUF2232 domain-containing protein [Coriobacteriia bacterium]|nr:DUF2232 domain-containing protein [Coriobacteriia bacterium]
MSLTAADIRDMVLGSLAAFAAAFVMPTMPFVGMPLAALALGWLSFRFGSAWGVASAIIATVAVTALAATLAPVSIGSALFVAVALLAAGPGAAWALRRWEATSVIAAVTLVLFAALLTASVLEASALHTTVAAQSAKEAKLVFDAFMSSSQRSAPDAALRANAATIVTQIALLWPSGLFVTVAFAAALAVPIVSWQGRRAGQEVSALPALADLDLSFHLVWFAIAGLALVAAAVFLNQSTGPLWALGMNLLVAARPALFVQGLAVFAALYRRLGVGRLGRGLGFVVLGLSELAIPSVSVAGLVDLFFNLRKRPRDGSGIIADPVGPAEV